MIPASHNPNVPPPEGPFKREERLIYTQKHAGRDYVMDAIFVQVSRKREGFAVVRVGPERRTATVPLRDLKQANPSVTDSGKGGSP